MMQSRDSWLSDAQCNGFKFSLKRTLRQVTGSTRSVVYVSAASFQSAREACLEPRCDDVLSPGTFDHGGEVLVCPRLIAILAKWLGGVLGDIGYSNGLATSPIFLGEILN